MAPFKKPDIGLLADIVDSKTRSRMMSGIRAKNTKPELLIRRALHKKGFRYRLHPLGVPGHPDLVFPRYKAVILVHGCFWHGHDCPFFRLPGTRAKFWKEKIARNRKRDAEVSGLLKKAGWRRLTVWECAMRGVSEKAIERLMQRIEKWLKGPRRSLEIRGRK